MYFKLKEEYKFGRRRVLKNNGRKVETPILFFGFRLGDKPHVWKHFRVDGVLTNAYDIYRNKKGSKEIMDEGIHSYLDCQSFIMMDSGGYYFLKEDRIDVDAKYVVEIQNKAKPDIGVSLDFPLNPNNPEDFERRIKLTGKNIKEMSKFAEFPMIRVIHGFDEISLKKSSKYIDDKHLIGVGSQVAMLYPFRVNKVKHVIDVVCWVRKNFPDSFIHVFGLGSPRLMPLMFFIGADSTDAKTWLWKGVRHMIFYQGNVYVIKKGTKSWTPLYEGKDYECDCPVCKEYGFNELLGEKAWKRRALHNAWECQREIEIIRKKIKDNEYEEFIEKRFK
ncbi:MAG: tRNA-guanine transglycosylase, partial [Candidatus Methanofastidiosia archaeon]